MRTKARLFALALAGALTACFPSLPPEVDDDADTAVTDDTAVDDTAVTDTAVTDDTARDTTTDPDVPPTGPPTIVAFDPEPHSVTLAPTGAITVRFDRPMAEPDGGEVVITSAQTGLVRGDFSDDVPTEIAFTPDAPLLAGDKVQVTLRRNLTSVGGDTLARSFTYDITVASNPGHGDFELSPEPITSMRPRGALGDRVIPARLTGDRLDLVVVADKVWIVVANGTGGWQTPTELDANLGASTAAVGDVDGDGHLDLLVSRPTASISVYLGSADGRFTRQATPLPGGQAAQLLELGDVDGDGDLDVVAVGAEELALFLNNGDGTFPAPDTFDPGPLPTALALGDMNRDGVLDFIVLSNLCCSGSAPIVVVTSDAEEGDWEEVSFDTGEGNQDMAVADFDGDGWLDVAVATGGAGGATRVHLNDGAGGLGQVDTIATGLVERLLAVDADGDGWVDLFANGQEIENNGSGTFGAPEALWTDLAVTAYGDVDADGDTDLIAVGATGLFLLQNVVDP